MKITYIAKTKYVKKTKKELKEESKASQGMLISTEKQVELKEPIYVVEMTNKEYQLVSFYLELEKRKPITNVEIDAKLGEEKK